MATVLLTSLAVLKLIALLMIIRYNNSVVSESNALETQRLAMRERKVLVDTRFTLVSFMVSFIPTVVLSILKPGGIYGNAVFPWSMTITLLISATNPIIHLWRNRQLRMSIFQIMWPCG